MKLASPKQTAAVLSKFGLRLTRDLGQNFLIDANVLDKIVRAAEIDPEDVVLEIGTGIGTLTRELAASARQVITVEIDKRLTPVLTETLNGLDNVKVLRMDAMNLTPELALVDGRAATKVVANLPYGVAAPVILKLLREFRGIRVLVVMVQREIADRMLASPGSKEYSGFTLKVKCFAAVTRLLPVSRWVFMPAPNVDSTVVKLTRWEKPPAPVDEQALFDFITAGFSQRRKRLSNAVADLPGVTKEGVERALEEMGLPPSVRAERLDLADFAKLVDRFSA
jgi:16S rRNA (adenine1518-N6/adenine1519-N6)-dimethyltransferase